MVLKANNVKFDKFTIFSRNVKKAGYIIEPTTDWPWPNDRDTHNSQILTDFYAAVEWLLSQGWEEYTELTSNTISPCTQNAFIPLREYRVKRNGHYRVVKIFARMLGGCYIEID